MFFQNIVKAKSSKFKCHRLGWFLGKRHQLIKLSLKGTILWDQTKIPFVCLFRFFQTFEEKLSERETRPNSGPLSDDERPATELLYRQVKTDHGKSLISHAFVVLYVCLMSLG